MARHARVAGRHGYHYYRPRPLPRALDLAPETIRALSVADRALGRLAGTGRLLPNPHLLVRPYLTAEALASSRIEGTQASLWDVFEAAAAEGDSPDLDVREVQNYIAAFEVGRQRLTDLPLSLRLIREVHARLMHNVRGEEKEPGQFRRSQNWIGPPGCTLTDAVFVPPPDPDMMEALADWASYLNDRDLHLPPLVTCALLHYQFENDLTQRLGNVRREIHILPNDIPATFAFASPPLP